MLPALKALQHGSSPCLCVSVVRFPEQYNSSPQRHRGTEILHRATLAAFGGLLLAVSFLLSLEPLVDALANELAEIFKLARRTIPKLSEHPRVNSKTVTASKALCWSQLVFVIRRELARRHRDHRQGTSRRQRIEDDAHARIQFFQPRQHAIVLIGAIRGRIFFAAGPLGLQCHARRAP